MDVALSRKRSRIHLDESDNDGSGSGNNPRERQPQPSPALSTGSATLKRSRTQDELDQLKIIRPEDAWAIDVASILASNTLTTPHGGNLKPHNNLHQYSSESIVVLCVQGNIQLHYDLLW